MVSNVIQKCKYWAVFSSGVFFFFFPLILFRAADAGKVCNKAGFGGIQLFQMLASDFIF